MTGWRLTWQGGAGGPPLDAGTLLPERLLAMTERDVVALPLVHGRERATVGDLFALGTSQTETLVLRGTTGRFRHVGRAMRMGSLVVEGDVGDHLARDMKGGAIELSGCAGAYAATGMTDGGRPGRG